MACFPDDGGGLDGRHDGRHPAASVEEWVFAAWTADASLGMISGHRIVGRTAWYWAALARADRPLLHIADFDVTVRSADPFIVKGEQMWAEHTREAPMEQWTIGNETYASCLDDPDDALGRAYGTPTPIAFDLEWYATGDPVTLDPATPDQATPDQATSGQATGDQATSGQATGGTAPAASVGYEQPGVVHGSIEILGEATVELVEVPAHRWHRWSTGAGGFGPLPLPEAVAHTGVRAPFSFPDGSSSDLVLSPNGWRLRARRPSR